MARHLSTVALLALALAACSGDPSAPSEHAHGDGEGTISVALTADNGGTTYRLSKATFVITGPTLANPLTVKPPPDTPIDTETLPTGQYSAVLKDGWVLESKAPDATTFSTVAATLITPNPTTFTVTKGGVTEVFFGFATGVGDVGLGQGTANIRIGVQDCTEFNGIGAALASFTIACLGTIEPKSYVVNTDGLLSRTFDTCPRDATALASIDGLLSLQLRSVRVPFAKECIAGRWATWKSQFDANNPIVCPTWSRQQIVNEPTDAQLKKLQSVLDNLAQDTTGRLRAQVPQLFDEGYLYGVTFANAAPPPNQKCQTAGDCGALCAGGFPGFVLQNDAGTVLTDGPYWLLDTQYAPGTDPFLRTGSYYHPMSYYGPSPGTQFANRNRVSTCPPGTTPTTAGSCGPEVCSYGVTNVHIPLRCDCLNVANNATCPASDTTCVGYCAP